MKISPAGADFCQRMGRQTIRHDERSSRFPNNASMDPRQRSRPKTRISDYENIEFVFTTIYFRVPTSMSRAYSDWFGSACFSQCQRNSERRLHFS